jgi:hypothetical protein
MGAVKQRSPNCFTQRILDLNEADLDRIVATNSERPDTANLDRDESNIHTAAIPFRNVFANHFNNVIRPRGSR